MELFSFQDLYVGALRAPPPPPSRTNWTRLVPLSVLTGHEMPPVRSVPAHTRRTARRALPCRLTRRRVRRALTRAGARDFLAASVPRNRQGHLVCPPPCSLRALHPSSPPALSARPVPQAAAARSAATACAARPVTCHVGSRDQPRDRSRARWQVPARGLQDRHGGA